MVVKKKMMMMMMMMMMTTTTTIAIADIHPNAKKGSSISNKFSITEVFNFHIAASETLVNSC
jgi:hypothetical protein